MFRFGPSQLCLDFSNISIREMSEGDLTKEKAACKTKIGHTALSWVEAISVLEDGSHSRKADESIRICDSRKEAQQRNNRGE